MNAYPLGARIRIYTKQPFQDLSTVPVAVDPTTVSLYINKPLSGIVLINAQPPLVNDGVGLYHYDVNLDEEGKWAYKWEGGGSLVAASDDVEFYVGESVFVS